MLSRLLHAIARRGAVEQRGKAPAAAPSPAAAFESRISAAGPDNAGLQSCLDAAANLHPEGLTVAESAYRRILERWPNSAHAWSNLGALFLEHGATEEALGAFTHAVELKPLFGAAHLNRGLALARLSRTEDAILSYRRASQALPQRPEPHVSLAHLLLDQGELAEGWREYEWRDRLPQNRTILPDVPRWRGEPLEGRRVLVCVEQGAGDALWAFRFLPRLRERGVRFTLLCTEATRRLVQSSFPWLPTTTSAELRRDEFEVLVPIMSLPALLGVNAPAAAPGSYLGSDPSLAQRWSARVAAHEGFRVGLVWAGNPEFLADAERSIPPSQLAPLKGTAGAITWFSLQSWREGEPPAMPFPMVDLMQEVKDYADTAALVRALDLVIAVDTSVSHLAPAVGTPTFLLSRFRPGWRWLIGGRESPWYASVRLFRPPAPGDWSPIIPSVAAAVSTLACGRGH